MVLRTAVQNNRRTCKQQRKDHDPAHGLSLKSFSVTTSIAVEGFCLGNRQHKAPQALCHVKRVTKGPLEIRAGPNVEGFSRAEPRILKQTSSNSEPDFVELKWLA
jgi:hypothetical protein